jgi:hypothetical protein
MTRPALPSSAFPIIDTENNATVSFNEWEGFVDGQVVSLGIGATGREPLPPGVIIMAAKPVIPYAKWLLWINRSVATFGTPTRRPPLPTSNVQLVGVDRKATIPFQTWLQYIDKLLG